MVSLFIACAGENVCDVEIRPNLTGEQGFSYFYEKDTFADHLLWIHFGTFCADASADTILVAAVTTPRRFFTNPQKIRWKTFLRAVGAEAKVIKHRLQLEPVRVA